MKCIVCGEPATIKLKRHRAKFCEYHFFEHIKRQVLRSIKQFKMFDKNTKIGLAISGGKDSMSAWNILIELGYELIAVHIDMGFGEYSERSREIVKEFSEQKNSQVYIYKLEELLGFDFERAMKYSRKPPCSLCGSLKRYYLNKIAMDLNIDVMVTAHNLDDEAAFLLGNVLYWKDGYLKRQSPVLLPEHNMVKKVKPLIRLTDEELKIYADLKNIPYYSGKCPNAREVTTHFYKKILNELQEEFNDVKSQFYFGFLRFMDQYKNGQLFRSAEKDTNYCKICGYKTLNEDLCFVCSLKERVSESV